MKLIAACLLCWVGLAQSAAALDRGTFGPFVRSLNDTKHGYQVVRDPTGVAPSKQVERFEVRPGDCNRNGGWDDCTNDRERSELSEQRKTTKAGDEVWYGWSVYVPPDWQNVWPTKTALGQFHQKGSHVIWMFQNDKGGLLLDQQVKGRTTKKYPLLSARELRGRWNRIEVHVKWSTRIDGFFHVYINGTRKVAYAGKTTTARNVYFKYGVYRSFLRRYKRQPGHAKCPARRPISPMSKRPTVGTDCKDQRGLRFAKMRCNVRRCMFSRRAVSLTFRSHSS